MRIALAGAGSVKLVADWTLLDTNGKPGRSRTEDITVGGSSPITARQQ